jgi:hypothetical protein
MIRRVSTHQARTNDNELLTVVTVFEPGIRKQDVNRLNQYCKTHAFLTDRRKKFKWISE